MGNCCWKSLPSPTTLPSPQSHQPIPYRVWSIPHSLTPSSPEDEFKYSGYILNIESSEQDKHGLAEIMDNSFTGEPTYDKWRLSSDDAKLYQELGGIILYLKNDNKCVSMITLNMTSGLPDNSSGEDIIYVCNVGTHKDYRRKGYMSKLFKELHNFCEYNGIKTLKIFVEIDNHVAIEFYNSQGFTKTDQIFNRVGVDEIFMVKRVVTSLRN